MKKITKFYFMVEIVTDEHDNEGNAIIINEDVMEDDLKQYILNCKYGVSIIGNYVIEFGTSEEEIEELKEENQELRDRLENISSHINDLKSTLSDVEYYADEIESESNY